MSRTTLDDRPYVSEWSGPGTKVVREALAAIRRGKPVVLVDADHEENGADLVFAAEYATPQLVAFAVRHGSGFLCVAVTDADADRLDLPSLATSDDARRPRYAVSVDAREGTSTGISAADRALTVRTLADARTDSSALTRPGHVVPLRTSTGGALRHPDVAEAAVDLAVLAGLRPAAALCKLVSDNDPRELAQGAELRNFAQQHGLPVVSIAELVNYRLRNSTLVTATMQTIVQLRHGTFRAVKYQSIFDERRHIAFVMGTVARNSAPVRIERECTLRDVFGSPCGDCANSIDQSLAAIASVGRGALVYLRRPEHAPMQGPHPASEIVKHQLIQDMAISADILRNLDPLSVDLLAPHAGEAEALGRFGVPVQSREAPTAASAMTRAGNGPHRVGPPIRNHL
ncbi:3,4-dihydroxy-2-butanone-4-phosphate synthase (plasmid) [Mycolicibacterium psychrotolerans]|uniref:3,4-dihydroxy-2-butanone-4-phosphate synthase n=1 Tax=Mycolicibacterium psychrotolerans TaxID=216929 RepID=UPI003D674A17